MALLRNVLAAGFCLALVGCGQRDLKVDVAQGANPWTHLNMYNDPADFQFAIMADRTGGSQEPIFAEAVEKVNQMRPEFVMCIGDLIEGHAQDVNEIDRQWEEFDGFMQKLEMPFFYMAGNHDVTNATMLEEWQARRGRVYYHFVYKDVLFCVLNTQDGKATGLGDEQLEHFKKVLGENRDVRWTLVFMHQPVWRKKDVPNWGKLEEALADRDYTVFAGHTHTYRKEARGGRRYYTLGTTGGGRYEGAPPMDLAKGRFDHIVWVTMTDEGPLMANILAGAIYDDEPVKSPQ
jgi:3',5'-cyclic AMP phosphodiesterase CpdA